MKKAKWIWCSQQDIHGYNLAAQFKKEFRAGKVKKAVLHITADSQYRVALNGTWINDGPGRAYPEHWSFDRYDVTSLLKRGMNRIEVTARYYGTGTFHQIPQQAGLLAELNLDGTLIGTDASWLAAPLDALCRWTPKVSCQMEPVESFDARLSASPDWKSAVELFASARGPWKDLSPRRSPPLTKKRCRMEAVQSILRVKRVSPRVCVPVTRIAWPELIEANQHTGRPVVLASVLILRKKQAVDFSSIDWKVAVDGVSVNGEVTLPAGKYAVLFFCVNFYGHAKELSFPFLNQTGLRWSQWQVFVKEEFLFRCNDRLWHWFPNEEAECAKQNWLKEAGRLSGVWKNPESAIPAIGKKVEISEEQLFMEDFHTEFMERTPAGPADRCVENATAICRGGKGSLTVHPVRGGDVEICYDLGVQRCGYLDCAIKADAGVTVDIHLVEYIKPDGTVQHTEGNRNGTRYVTKAGINRHTSFKRRSGRFVFVTFRNLAAPVKLLKLDMIESTADVSPVKRFCCSDTGLTRIWDICERTLKLDMEDVFTDCPLYEQTLWIGDARNEALYAFHVYGGYDVSARSLELGAQSLEHFPIVGSQVPSGWDCILPAWSFLWGIHVWEHYFYSGDRRFIKKLWPDVLRNIDGALSMLDEHGLFSGTFWNMIEWAPIDHAHSTVLHNSILLAGAMRAAERCAETLSDDVALRRLQARRRKLVKAINVWWDESKKSYPDAILEDGTPSSKICQHTSFLAVMCGVLPRQELLNARNNLLHPPAGMTQIGSPFAMQFFYEALEILDEPEAVMESIRKNYMPMLEAGATTVWEAFPGSTTSPPDFPTRSHCHAWAGSPLQFFNRIVLGIRQTAVGGKAFEVSPWVRGLGYASGAMATPDGPVQVDWKISGETVNILVSAPQGTRIQFIPNRSLAGLKVRFERKK